MKKRYLDIAWGVVLLVTAVATPPYDWTTLILFLLGILFTVSGLSYKP